MPSMPSVDCHHMPYLVHLIFLRKRVDLRFHMSRLSLSLSLLLPLAVLRHEEHSCSSSFHSPHLLLHYLVPIVPPSLPSLSRPPFPFQSLISLPFFSLAHLCVLLPFFPLFHPSPFISVSLSPILSLSTSFLLSVSYVPFTLCLSHSLSGQWPAAHGARACPRSAHTRAQSW